MHCGFANGVSRFYHPYISFVIPIPLLCHSHAGGSTVTSLDPLFGGDDNIRHGEELKRRGHLLLEDLLLEDEKPVITVKVR